MSLVRVGMSFLRTATTFGSGSRTRRDLVPSTSCPSQGSTVMSYRKTARSRVSAPELVSASVLNNRKGLQCKCITLLAQTVFYSVIK